MFIGGMIHLYNKLEGEDWCSQKSNDEYDCIGKVWYGVQNNSVGDTNTESRSVFTFKPDDFVILGHRLP
eukprot:UN20295